MTNVTDEQEIVRDPKLIAAKIAHLKAQTKGQELDNRLAQALATTAELATEREVQRNEWDNAGPAYHRILNFSGDITQSSVAQMIDILSRWDRIDNQAGEPDRGYTIVLCSPGGDVIHGFQAYSYLRGLASRRPLTITAAGVCASMATVLHQAASEGRRVIEPGCTYLLHEVSGGVGGRIDNIKDTTDWLHQLNSQIHGILAERSNKDADEIATIMHRHEKFLSAEEAIEWGLADILEYTTI